MQPDLAQLNAALGVWAQQLKEGSLGSRFVGQALPRVVGLLTWLSRAGW